MAASHAGAILDHIRSFAETYATQSLSDGQLLQRFTVRRDGEAFATLMRRHGRLVWTVCRHILASEHDAEDAFQAAFLVLARRAASIRKTEAVAEWLHGVAYRIAVRAKQMAAKRLGRERQAAAVARRRGDQAKLVVPPDAALRDLQALLHEEVAGLPEKYRKPFVLCCLEGRSWKEAAAELAWKEGTLATRIAHARKLLQTRLARRGVTLSSALTAGVLWGQPASAALIQATQKAAALIATGQTVSAAASPTVAVLVERAVGAVGTKAKLSVLLIFVGIIGGSLGLATSEQPAVPGQQSKSEAKADAALAKSDERKAKTDLYGDPLPEGAVMRLGTLERRAVGAKLGMSADGKSIIGVRGGKYIYVWDADTGKLREKRELPVDDAWRRYWLSDDGRLLATQREAGVAVWDVWTGEEKRMLPAKERGFVDPFVFSADSKMAAAMIHADGQTKTHIHVWSLADGKELFAKEFRVTGTDNLLAFSPNGKQLFGPVASEERGMRSWEIATGKELWRQEDFYPQSMIFTPDGKILSTDDKYRVVDPATGKPLPNNKVPGLTWDMLPKLTPDGRTLLVSTNDDIIVWDLIEGKEIRTLKPAGKTNRMLTQLGGQFLVAPDGKSIITSNGALQRWDLTTGRPLWPDNFDAGHVEEVTSLIASVDGKRLASASADGTVRLWDLMTGKAIHVWRGHEWRRHNLDWRMVRAGVTALDMTPDGHWVLSAGSEGKIHLHDAATGKQAHAIPLPERERGEDELRVFHLRITPDGTKAVALFGAQGFIFSTGPGGIDPPLPKYTYKLATWDLKTGALVDRRAVEMLPVRSSAISPDGRTFLAGGVLTGVRTGKEIAKLEGAIQGGSNEPAAFSPDGALIVGVFTEETKKDGRTIHSPGGIRVWEAATGKTVAHLKTKSWVGQVAIHPNNRYVITNDYDGIQIWDATTGKVVAVRQMHEKIHSSTTSGSFASCLAFTPDGRRLATGHPNSTILFWDVPLPPVARQPLASKELETFWTNLGDADAAKAWRVLWRLSDGSAVPLLREHLKPVPPVPAEKVGHLLEDLDNESFEKRQEAVKKLKALGPGAAAVLREALDGTPTPETKRRLQEVLAAYESHGPFFAEAVRDLRAVIALERIGTPEARQLLQKLATGAPDACQTREAKAALERLIARSAKK